MITTKQNPQYSHKKIEKGIRGYHHRKPPIQKVSSKKGKIGLKTTQKNNKMACAQQKKQKILKGNLHKGRNIYIYIFQLNNN